MHGSTTWLTATASQHLMAQHALPESSGGEGNMHTPSSGISGSEATHAPR